ncbi:MAG: glycosyl hydrolase [Bacteroidetes bacterium]|nr:glycosyl hydrolase [Bacteroidota bacterium]
MKKNVIITTLSIALFMQSIAIAQVKSTPANDRINSLKTVKDLHEKSLVKNLQFQNIGPTIMSGRVTDLDVNPDNPFEFYVAYASGGLWYTNNNGLSFTPVFDNEEVMTIGDIAVHWKSGTIYVGTGEVNSSRSSYAGIGIYKSTDKGNTWKNIGLPESHHIGAILIHPDNPDIVWVAALGHLYSANKERGIYKTIDGGNSWKQVLYVDENTGGVELSMQANDPNSIYAAMWNRERRAWDLVESGKGSGIYKSTDGGDNWNKLNTESSGFPSGEGAGRIGIAVAPTNSNIVYAIIDNQFPREEEKEEIIDTSIYTINDFKNITKEKFLDLNNIKLDAFLTDNYFPEKYTADVLKQKVASGEFRPTVVNEYLSLGDYVFNSPIKGCEVYRSDDAGISWKKTYEGYLDDVYYTYGYYFGKIHVSPQNADKIIIYGVPILKSVDGGKSWNSIDADNMHGDFHALWFNPKNDDEIIVGNDGGINITYDGGKNWIKPASPPVGQFYSVEVDNATPYNVYGGLQDNGVWFGPSTYTASSDWQSSGKYPYEFINGGDGMQVQVDSRDNSTIYSGFQFGYYSRINIKENDELEIRPRQDVGEYPLRFNWETPIWLSRHNRDILYYGSNRFHRSLNKGSDLETLSPDLTTNPKQGDVPYGTITTIHESPLKFGLLYCGTDDGKIHFSNDGGYSWKEISKALPQGLWVSRVWASAHKEGRLYVALNGYRSDNFQPYIFVTEDNGTTWTNISSNLPFEPVNVIKEGPANENLLFVGTDNGLYVSLDRGKTYMAFSGGLPRVAVHDLVIQEREKDLVVGTHGRSIYRADLEELSMMNAEVLNSELYVFPVEKMRYNKRQGNKYWNFGEPVEQSITLPYFSSENANMKAEIFNTGDTLMIALTDTAEAGLNYFIYSLTIDDRIANSFNASQVKGAKNYKKADNGKYYLKPGEYYCLWTKADGATMKQPFTISE